MVNFIKNFWQGKQTLVKSLWIYYLLINLLLGYLETFFSILLDNIFPGHEDIVTYIFDNHLYLTLLIIIYLLFSFTYFFWSLIGTWRSASNYSKIKNKRAIWSILTKIFLILSIIAFTWDLWVHLFNE